MARECLFAFGDPVLTLTRQMEHPRTQEPHPSSWLTPNNPTLGAGEVHVWRASLDASDADVGRLERWLSVDERQRADRFRFDRDRRRFVVRRAHVRALLGQYLSASPRLLAFVYGPHGKPALASPFDSAGLCFNVSRSQDLALFALTYHRLVGIDIEWIRPMPDIAAIARRYFSDAENFTLNGLEPPERLLAFFNYWTRKEAYLKATGEGLTRRLDSVELSPTPGEPARLRLSGDSDRSEHWSLFGLAPAPGFVGAIAAAGDQWTVRCWHWAAQIP